MLLEKIPDSPAFEIFNLASKKREAGEKVFSLSIGEPSFDTPLPIVNAAYESMKSGGGHYSSSWGSRDLREAIVEKVRRKNRVNASLENVIFITTKLSIYASLLSLARTRFEVLVPDPGYYYSEPVALSGGKPVRYKLGPDFRLDMDEIEAEVTPRTRAIIVNTPSNPAGKVFDRKDLRGLLELCLERDIKVISDEAYEDLVYEKQHVSLGSLEGSPTGVISLFSLSKSFAMTGWRAGYVVADAETILRVNRFLETAVTCLPPFIQAASAYALRNCERYTAEFREELRKRRALLDEGLSEIPGLESQKVEGAFYGFPRFKASLGSRVVANRLLSEQNVAVLPGVIFGPSGERHLRISFGSPPETIVEGTRRLKAFFKGARLNR
ncbi:MAG TPA: aminotransferase class I/II-fold pyridoxal phosphate-dependent enzyme [Nitrososphaerales archaeon]|nr:aminotransferase class I/II-fold pyridoxal phosphate-dependent enzyme [Nitrososphaerales archaeon]